MPGWQCCRFARVDKRMVSFSSRHLPRRHPSGIAGRPAGGRRGASPALRRAAASGTDEPRGLRPSRHVGTCRAVTPPGSWADLRAASVGSSPALRRAAASGTDEPRGLRPSRHVGTCRAVTPPGSRADLRAAGVARALPSGAPLRQAPTSLGAFGPPGTSAPAAPSPLRDRGQTCGRPAWREPCPPARRRVRHRRA